MKANLENLPSDQDLKKLFLLRDGAVWWSEGSGRRHAGKRAGCVCRDGYIRITFDGRQYLAHRIAFAMTNGYWPLMVDHIDGNKQNNSPENLRPSNFVPNGQNRTKLMPSNKSGVNGVGWSKSRNQWTSYIKARGKSFNLGYFECLGAAIKARKNAEERLWRNSNPV